MGALGAVVWSLRRRTTNDDTRAATRTTTLAKPRAQRTPTRSAITPMIMAPMGAPPWLMAMYSAMTRPRIAGSLVTCTVEFDVVRAVMLARPDGMRTRANSKYEGASAISNVQTATLVMAMRSVRSFG